MAQFVVRNLEDDIHEKLRALADSHGQSMEEFVREILRRFALERRSPQLKLGTRIADRFSSIGLEENIQELRGQAIDLPEFDR